MILAYFGSHFKMNEISYVYCLSFGYLLYRVWAWASYRTQAAVQCFPFFNLGSASFVFFITLAVESSQIFYFLASIVFGVEGWDRQDIININHRRAIGELHSTNI